MPREFMCAYGNCNKTKLPICITMADERVRFCSPAHAAVAMVRRAWIAAPHPSYEERKFADAERILREVVGDGRDKDSK